MPQRNLVLLALVFTLLLSLSGAGTPAFAQARYVDGVLVRDDLKGPPPPPRPTGGVSTESVAEGAVFNCPRGVCQVPILVSRGGFTDQALKNWDPTFCSVYSPYYKLKVAPRLRPTLRWVLLKDPTDTESYYFDPTYGIQLLSAPNNPGDFNDPSQDLYNYRLDAADGTAFVWQDLHTRPDKKTINFIPKVYRAGKDNRPCNAGDPVVFNDN